MQPTMTARHLHLSLQAGADVPRHRSWRIDEGCLLISSWSDRGDPFTLGLWGPGELVIPSLVTQAPMHLHALSSARVEEAYPSDLERENFLLLQCLQTSTLLPAAGRKHEQDLHAAAPPP